MTHHLIHTGAGKRCQRCGVNWDTGEEVDEVCSAERDPNTDDLFDRATEFVVDMMLGQKPYADAARAFQNACYGGKYATGGVLGDSAGKPWSTPVSIDPKNPAIKQGLTDLAEQLRNPKPEPMMTQVAGTHYSSMAIQPTEFCMKNGWDFCLGAILKYLSRYRVKNGIEDLKKARHFVLIRQGYATHAEPPRCRLITMNTYIFENSIKREDSYALILLDEYAGSAGHHMNVNADRLVVEIDKLIAAQERLSAHRQHFSG